VLHVCRIPCRSAPLPVFEQYPQASQRAAEGSRSSQLVSAGATPQCPRLRGISPCLFRSFSFLLPIRRPNSAHAMLVGFQPKIMRVNQDPFRVRREAQLGRLKRRGKGPPKKGQGKRSKKK
jgi:hypothetical protein